METISSPMALCGRHPLVSCGSPWGALILLLMLDWSKYWTNNQVAGGLVVIEMTRLWLRGKNIPGNIHSTRVISHDKSAIATIQLQNFFSYIWRQLKKLATYFKDIKLSNGLLFIAPWHTVPRYFLASLTDLIIVLIEYILAPLYNVWPQYQLHTFQSEHVHDSTTRETSNGNVCMTSVSSWVHVLVVLTGRGLCRFNRGHTVCWQNACHSVEMSSLVVSSWSGDCNQFAIKGNRDLYAIKPIYTLLSKYIRVRIINLGLISHVCVANNSSYFPNDANMHLKSNCL